ncbi:MAG: SAM-dependent methyltransferase [Methanomicrobiales archaeon]
MASIVLEVLEHGGVKIEVAVIPEVTASNAGASVIGSPLYWDFAVISLSDLLTPLKVIEKRRDAIVLVGIPVVL